MIRATKAVVLLVAVAMSLGGCALIGASEAPRDETGTIDKQATADAFSIRVGDCLNDPGEGDVDRVSVVPCSEPHELEVFHEFSIQDAAYPNTADAMDELTYEKCDPVFRAFVGRSYEDSRLEYTSLQPTELSWADGDRVVHCLIADPENGKSTGSLASSNR
ncbi:septum formation family protein [Paeniglutamicibacter sp. MACA_103]|uniref:septum formation family protein n=1 Tax=Paeniglutamicibacter sp. MACA_103 TaxID=3377337 RepID=UPI003895D736